MILCNEINPIHLVRADGRTNRTTLKTKKNKRKTKP